MVSFVPRLPARPADILRAAGAGGVTGELAEPVTLLDGSAPPPVPPNVDMVPCYGPQTFAGDADRRAFAEQVLCDHRPGGHEYRLQLAPPFLARETDRPCLGPFCRGHCGWPCHAVEWAANILTTHDNGQAAA